MTSLLLASNSASRVILVNLNKTLLVDLWYLRLWVGNKLFATNVDLVTDEDELHRALEKPIDRSDKIGRVIAVRAADHVLIQNSPLIWRSLLRLCRRWIRLSYPNILWIYERPPLKGLSIFIAAIGKKKFFQMER